MKKKLLCNLLGHKIFVQEEEISKVFSHIEVSYGYIKCSRCKQEVSFVANVKEI